jgi:hypothetical protein
MKGEKMSDEQADDTSTPIVTPEYYTRFLAGKETHPGRQDFANQFLQISAETNRRLQRQQAEAIRQQAEVLKAQNVLIESQNTLIKSQDRVAKSLTFATWVLAAATIILAAATAWTIFAKPQTPVAAAPAASPTAPNKSVGP